MLKVFEGVSLQSFGEVSLEWGRMGREIVLQERAKSRDPSGLIRGEINLLCWVVAERKEAWSRHRPAGAGHGALDQLPSPLLESDGVGRKAAQARARSDLPVAEKGLPGKIRAGIDSCGMENGRNHIH